MAEDYTVTRVTHLKQENVTVCLTQYAWANGHSSTKAIPQLCVTLHACSQAFVEFPLGLKGLCPKGELLLTSSQLLALENVGKVFGGLPIF